MSEATTPTILCVDDDQSMLATMKKILLKQGYNVLAAGNGAQALKVLLKKTPDLILMDAMMPGMTGYEVCSRLQENPNTAYIPVIFVTGLGGDKDKAKAFAAGAADYLLKPVEKIALLEKIGLHLRTNERWRILLQPQRTTSWDARISPSDFSRFMDFLYKEVSVPEYTRSRLSAVDPIEIYSLTTELGVSDIELSKYIAGFCKLPYLANVDAAALQLGVLPATFCKTNGVVVIRTQDGDSAFVVSNPFCWELFDALRITMAHKEKYRLMITQPGNLDALLAKRSTPSAPRPSRSMSALEQKLRERHQVELETISLNERDEESAPIIELVNKVITSAHKRGASDIHIEPWENEIIIRYRIDGHLSVANRLRPRSLIHPLVTRIKIMSRLDIAERRLPQDGRIVFGEHDKNANVDLRVSTAPTNFGEKVVMRILDKTRSVMPLAKLGFSKRHLEIYKQKITIPYGMILHVGPTGSGKSMTLYAALNEVRRPELNIQTIEDPIEYTLPGIIQMQVNPGIGLTFGRALRSYLRQDPDVILLGEIRDRETAHVAVEAALTGHLLLSTLHTNDAPSTIVRLIEMGIEPFMVSSSIGLVCAQRLLRRLCPECKEPHEPDAEQRQRAGISEDEDIRFYRSVGCPACDNVGYRGRIGTHELLVPNGEMRHTINKNAVTAEKLKRIAVETCGMTTIYWDAIEKVRDGICSLGDVLTAVCPDDFDTRPPNVK